MALSGYKGSSHNCNRYGVNCVIVSPVQPRPIAPPGNSINENLAPLFECPVCFDFILPPIFQCQSGHLVCNNCLPKLHFCPTCRGPLGNIRNLFMEKVAMTFSVPCKYMSSGCDQYLHLITKNEHEEECPYRPFSCPCPGGVCKWIGSLEEVISHMSTYHSIVTLIGSDIIFLATGINIPGAVNWVLVQSCFGYDFILLLEKKEIISGYPQYFAFVQIIGTPKQAECFVYRLELNHKGRRIMWESAPKSIHEGIPAAIGESDCLIFDTSMIRLFEDQGNLPIAVTIIGS